MKVQRPRVWVNTGDLTSLGKPALLLEWRQTPFGEWEGRVVILNGGFHHPEDVVTICWVKAEYLRPVQG